MVLSPLAQGRTTVAATMSGVIPPFSTFSSLLRVLRGISGGATATRHVLSIFFFLCQDLKRLGETSYNFALV